MRKTLVFAVVCVLATSVWSAEALAAPSPKATGGGTATSGTGTVDFSFVGQASDSNAKGNFSLEFLSGALSGQSYEGEVSCLAQSGNVGVLGGFVTETNNPTITFIRITVQDNGEGSHASGPDLIRIQRFASAPPVSSRCQLPDGGFQFDEVLSGNIQVH
jgi:hypothetical protein